MVQTLNVTLMHRIRTVARKAKRSGINHVHPVFRASRTVPNRKRENPKKRRTRRREVVVIPYVLTIDTIDSSSSSSSGKDTSLHAIPIRFLHFFNTAFALETPIFRGIAGEKAEGGEA